MSLVGRFWGGGGDKEKVKALFGLENDDYSGRPLTILLIFEFLGGHLGSHLEF